MNLLQYKICSIIEQKKIMKNFNRFYDKILNGYESNFVTVAISWLHIIKPDIPGYLKNTSFDKKNNYFLYVLKFIKRITFYCVYLITDVFYKNKKKNLKKKDIIIISHCLNKHSINKKKDFYFEKFEDILKKQKKSYCILLINHTNLNSSYLNQLNKVDNKYVLEKYLNPFFETKIFYLQIKEFFRLYKLYFFSKNKFEKKCIKNICLSIFDSQTKFSLRMYLIFKTYLNLIEPSKVIFTHEGFAWERLCIKASKEFNKDIKVIGYQHSPISKKNLAILKNINGLYNPNMIWASGNKSFKILNQSKKLNKVKIILSGYFKKINSYQNQKKIKLNCLVVPGATVSENLKLFNFSLKCALKNKLINFTWRVHPLINFFNILKKLKLNLKEIPKNIKISKNNFKNDINQNSFVLYNDSTAVIEAASGGNIPIYLNLKDQPNIDPICDYQKSRIYVSSTKNFVNLFRSPLNYKRFKKIRNSAREIVSDIYTKINENKLLKSLK